VTSRERRGPGEHAGSVVGRGSAAGGNGRRRPARADRHHGHRLSIPGRRDRSRALLEHPCTGQDAVTDIPPDRWALRKFYDPEPGKPGKINTRSGGFVEGIDLFDPHFFGISPREAGWMDPQQRLLLEAVWEALEDGGHVIDRATGSAAGVFIGISATDYMTLQTSFRDTTGPDIYTSTGAALSIAANRISFCFNLRGPSVAVDTACSSALVAVHLACQSLWRHECPLVLAGGVNAILSPHLYVGFTRMSMLSPDGQCRAFDARANGFVRSEGAGVVVLKRLSDALASGDRIYALIVGSAANQDGHTSGLTVPSQRSQEALVRDACRHARVDPARVQYVEAHGTGTPVGDPIEARALGTVLGAGRRDGDDCVLGSVKTNIGHLEAGSGIAGLIKTALALKHRMIPPNLHFHEPNPDIPFESLRLRVPRALEPWPQGASPALAGVNSFGFGGTNAHVILQEGPADTARASTDGDGSGGARLVPLSARAPEALRALARAYSDLLRSDGDGRAPWTDIVYSTSVRRAHHDHRLAVVAHGREELADALEAVAAGEAVGVSARAAGDQRPRVAFVFAGQGPQWWAMGRQLLAEEPVFRETIEGCDRLLGA
jgi:acyl transferase domain-containing protein